VLGQFQIPTDRWTQVQIHQRFDSTHPLTEVFVDGRLVVSSALKNWAGNDPSVATSLQVGLTDIASSNVSWAYFDDAFIDGGQRWMIGAPPAPLGLQEVAGGAVGRLSWKPVDPVNGGSISYSVYKCDSSSTGWVRVSDKAAASQFDLADTSWSAAYRVTAIETKNGIDTESGFTAPLIPFAPTPPPVTQPATPTDNC
jgi:hypothetical protein